MADDWWVKDREADALIAERVMGWPVKWVVPRKVRDIGGPAHPWVKMDPRDGWGKCPSFHGSDFAVAEREAMRDGWLISCVVDKSNDEFVVTYQHLDGPFSHHGRNRTRGRASMDALRLAYGLPTP